MKPQFAMHAVIWLLVGVTACTIHPPRRELLNGQLIIEGVPKIPIEILDELRPYQNSRSAQFLGWLDEGILISTRFANTAQLHRVAQPLGMRQQVTFEGEPVSSASLSPDPSAGGFVYSRDTSGSEFYQLYWFDLATAESRLLTDGESRYTDVAWAPSGRRFAYTTTERNGTDWDLHIQDLSGRKAVALEDRGVGWIALDWTPDEKRLLATQFKSMAQGTLHEVDLETRLVTNLLDTDLDVAIDLACYDGTGDAVFFASDMGAEFKRLHRLDLITGDIDLVTGDIPWDVEEFDVSPDGDKLAMVINEDGYSRLYVVRTKDLGFIALPEIPTGVIYQVAFAPDSSRVGFVLNRPTAPADVFSIDFEARKLTRWTQSELGGLVARNIVEPELFRYRSFDGRDIPAFIYRPNARPPYPVLVRIHGGPEGQARPRFS
ncbi:MAG: hypothetical protein O7H39_04515 [Gammaproteobacteria bacterium]|nr:hypothetical protein [Gammaproteobacteria bacterium]